MEEEEEDERPASDKCNKSNTVRSARLWKKGGKRQNMVERKANANLSTGTIPISYMVKEMFDSRTVK